MRGVRDAALVHVMADGQHTQVIAASCQREMGLGGGFGHPLSVGPFTGLALGIKEVPKAPTGHCNQRAALQGQLRD